MKIIFYGRLGDRLGRELEIDLAPEARTVADLREALKRRHPEAADDLARPSVRACIGDRIAAEDDPLPECGTVEFFPPLSGG